MSEPRRSPSLEIHSMERVFCLQSADWETGSEREKETGEASGTHRKRVGRVGRTRKKGRPPNVPLGVRRTGRFTQVSSHYHTVSAPRASWLRADLVTEESVALKHASAQGIGGLCCQGCLIAFGVVPTRVVAQRGQRNLVEAKSGVSLGSWPRAPAIAAAAPRRPPA